MTTFLVGVDGSEHSREAVNWARDFARPDDTIVLLHVWDLPAVGGFAGTYMAAEELERQAELLLEREEQLLDLGDDGPTVERRPVRGHPAKSLIEASDDADLVVVGSRGLSGFMGTVLGSVSLAAVHNAHCPVVVVRDR